MIFHYLVNHVNVKYIFGTFYLLNFIFGVVAFKLGFARKLPLLKTVIIYILFAIGTFVISIFSVMRLPITECLILLSFVLGIYRYRMYKQRSKANYMDTDKKTSTHL